MQTQNATILQLIETFDIIATHHGDINVFFQGHPYDFTANEKKNYAMLAVEILPATFNPTTIQYNFRLFVTDLVVKGQKNQLEVQSNCIRILWDVVQILGDEAHFNFDVLVNSGVNPLDESSDDYTAGWWMDIGVDVATTFTACDIPLKS